MRINTALDEQVVAPYYMKLLAGGLMPGFSRALSKFRSDIEAMTDADVAFHSSNAR